MLKGCLPGWREAVKPAPWCPQQLSALDGVDKSRLSPLGELHKPSVADLFVATMKGTYA